MPRIDAAIRCPVWAALMLALPAACGSAGSGSTDEIAFVVTGRNGNTHIVATDAEGKHRRDITAPSSPMLGGAAGWSPTDDKAILAEGLGAVWLVNPETGGLRRLASGRGAAWAPDGTRVALFQPGNGIVIVSPSGEQLGQIDLPFEPAPVDNPQLAWSPERPELAILITPDAESGFPNARLYRVPLDGGEPTLLSDSDKCCVDAKWLPGAERIAYLDSMSEELWAIDREGGSPRKIKDGIRAAVWSSRGEPALAVLEADGVLSSIFIGTTRVLSGVPVSDLTWSVDGESLAVATERDVVIFGANGHRVGRIDMAARSVSFSPDGLRIALLGGELIVADRMGSNRWDVTTPHSDKNPAWSPDGTHIAFERKGARGPSHVIVARADGSDERDLGEGGYPQWARGGAAIVAVRIPATTTAGENADKQEIWLLDVDGEGERKLAEGLSPSVSTDGMRVAFVRYTTAEIYEEQYTDSSTLFAIGVDGKAPRRIASMKGTEAAHFNESIWLAGDQQLAVRGSSIESEKLYLVSLDGRKKLVSEMSYDVWGFSAHRGNLAFLLPSYPREELVIRREDGDVVRVSPSKAGQSFNGPISWSPDGRNLALMVFTYETEKDEVYVVGSDGSGLKPLAEANKFDGGPVWRPRVDERAARSG